MANKNLTNDYTGMYKVRDLKLEDHKFILATFLKGLYYGDSWFSLIPKDIFMENYKKIAEALLATQIVQVACLADDEDVILGYSILGNNYQTIHWVFVKAAWRNGGIAKHLTPRFPTAITHLTTLGKVLISKFPTAQFNPFII